MCIATIDFQVVINNTGQHNNEKNIMGWLLLILKSPLVILYILFGFVVIVTLHLLAGDKWYQRKAGKLTIRWWMKVLAVLVGLRVHVRGTPVEGLLVANHISWLDIMALDTVTAARFVSKDDVLKWPVIGLLPKWSGTFFLQRGSAAAVSRLNAEIVAALKQNASVAVFPEGTTSSGEEVHRFYSAILQAGIDSKVPVQPVVIRYYRNGERDTVVPFIGEISFFEHATLILRRFQTHVYLDFGEAFIPQENNRKALSEHLHQQVEKVFSQPLN